MYRQLFWTVYRSAGTDMAIHSCEFTLASSTRRFTIATGPPHSNMYNTKQMGNFTANSCISTATCEL